MTPYHIPVLSHEVLQTLEPLPGQLIVDGTLGGAGHARLLLERIKPGGTLIGLDRDSEALEAAKKVLSGSEASVMLLKGNFRNLAALLSENGINEVDAVLLDLGVSSHMLDTPERGFSFRQDAPLDMRMNPDEGESAAELIAKTDEKTLCSILLEYGEERWAARIAKFIIEEREKRPIATTLQLADIVSRAVPRKAHPPNVHVATRVFQAMRIFCNDELGALKQFLDECTPYIRHGGRIAIISYHSLEDRIVKTRFARLAGKCICPPGLPICVCNAREDFRILTRKPIYASIEEEAQNSRARSAHLRVAQRI
jgi:16S rRNA (cytosine1402-N4)-methyltransferase